MNELSQPAGSYFFLNPKFLIRIVVSSDCGGPTGDGESENHTGRNKGVITPYKCHGRIAPFSTALFASLKAISSG